jgi:hypothetical protein
LFRLMKEQVAVFVAQGDVAESAAQLLDYT